MPVAFKYNCPVVHVASDVISDVELTILLCCMVWPSTVDILFFPTFQPNDYLFETHKDKGEEKWEIYAWAVRDLMCKNAGFKVCDQHYKEKKDYWKSLGVISY